MIRIVVVDDHPVVRDGVRSMLSGVSDFEVGHNTTSNRVINSAICGGGSAPFVARGRISARTTSWPRSFAACRSA